MTIKQIIGAVLLASPFVGLFIYVVIVGSLIEAIGIYAAVIVLVVLIYVGVWMVSDDQSGDEFEEHF